MPSRPAHRLLLAAVFGLTAVAAPLASAAEPADAMGAVLDRLGALLPAIRAIEPMPARGEALHPLGQDIRVALHSVRQAERFAAAGQMVKAAGKFQEVLDAPDVSVLMPVGRGAHLPLWRYCMTRILTGPEGLLKAYRASYEASARKMLDTAEAARETAALWGVVHRYGATNAALDALDVLAAVELERGRALAAARVLRTRLAVGRASKRMPPRLLAKLAVALARAGHGDELRELAAAVRAHRLDTPVEAEGKTWKLPRFVAALVTSLPQAPERGWGGVAPRPSALLWQVPLGPQPPSRTPRRRSRRRRRPEPVRIRLAGPSPLVHNGVVYCPTADEIKMVDLATGRVLNTVALGASEPSPAGSPAAERLAPPRGTGVVAPALHLGRAGAAVVVASPATYTKRGRPFGVTLIHAGRLSALRLPGRGAEGSPLWSLSTRSERAEDTFRLVSSPAAAHGIVAVGARLSQNETRAVLLGYDAATGRMLWRTHVATGSWIDPGQTRSRSLDSARPALHGGLAYYASDQGTVAAVDLADGSPLWLAQYEQSVPMECKLRTVGGEETSITAPPNRPILAGDTLFVLPADSEHLLALDAATGAVKWRRKRSHDGAVALFLLAADNQRVILSGSAVFRLDARTGVLVWRSVPLDSFPVGRAVLASDYVMAPVEGSIAMIDIRATGRLAEPVRWKTWRRDRVGSGNLTLLDGRLLVARNDSLSLFAGANWGDVLRARIARQPEKPKHHADLAVLHAGAREWTKAAAAFEKARALQRARGESTAATDASLADAYRNVAAGLEDAGRWAEATQVLAKALKLTADKPGTSRTALLHLRKARGHARSNDPKAALRTLHDVLGRFGDVTLRIPDGLFPGMHGVTARADVVATLQIASVVKEHGAETYSEYEAAAKAAAEPGRPALRVIERWPNSTVAAAFRLAEAQKAAQEQRFAAAAGKLLEAQQLCPGHDADRVKSLLSELAAARELRRRRPAPAKPGRTPRLLWQVSTKGLRTYKETVADLAATTAGRYTGERLLLANGKSLRAHSVADGKFVWETGTGWLGVRYQAAAFPPAGAPSAVLEIIEVLAGQPAEKAGMKAGDLLLSFDGLPIRRRNDLIQFCATTQPGRKVKLEIARGERRLTLEVVIGRRPTASRSVPFALQVFPQEFVRVVGVEGKHIIADVDLALLWIRREDGRIERRSIIGPYTDRMTSFRRRGGRPVMGDGVIIAPTPNGTLECFDLTGRRRWSVDMAAFDRKANLPRIVRVLPLPGRIAVITFVPDAGETEFTPALTLLDALSGATLFRKDLPPSQSPDACDVMAAGKNVAVFVPPSPDRHNGVLAAYDPPANKPVWTTRLRQGSDAKRLDRPRIYPPTATGDKFLMQAGPSALLAVDRASGAISWQARVQGVIRHVTPTKDRAFLVYARRRNARLPSFAIACVRLADGKVLWDKVIFREGFPRTIDAVPFARVSGGRLVLVVHIVNQLGLHLARPVVAVLGTEDGVLFGMIGMGGTRRYNVRGGKWGSVERRKDGVIGLITEAGLIGLSFDE